MGTASGDTRERPQLITVAALAESHAALRSAGYRVIGPTVRDGAIVLAELSSAADLPYGWGVALEPGGYRLRRRSDGAAFWPRRRAAVLETVSAPAPVKAVVRQARWRTFRAAAGR